MKKKFILTQKELFELISNSYEDGFNYAREFDEVMKKGNSNERNVISYTKNKIKELSK